MKKTILGIVLGLMTAMVAFGCQSETTDGKQAEDPKNQMKGGAVPEGGAVNPDQKDSGAAAEKPQ